MADCLNVASAKIESISNTNFTTLCSSLNLMCDNNLLTMITIKFWKILYSFDYIYIELQFFLTNLYLF